MSSKKVQPERHHRTILGIRDSFDEVEDAVLHLMEQVQYSERDLFSVRVAFEEALANALLHGHQGDETCEIEVHWYVTQDHVEIQVVDQGRGYDPEAIPDPTADENLTLPSGRGLAMIRAFMHDVSLNNRGNHLTMSRNREEE